MKQTMPTWKNIRERGAAAGMLFTLWVYRVLGRNLAEIVIWFVVVYFYLTNRPARQASHDFFTALKQKPQGLKHFLHFAFNSLDRFDFWVGTLRRYSFKFYGREHLDQLVSSQKGGLFFGAHFGNHDALRALAVDKSVNVHFLTDLNSSRLYASIHKRFCPRSDTGAVHYDIQNPQNILTIKNAVERGEFVGLLADRAVSETRRGTQRLASVSFLGKEAVFSKNPFIMAHLLQCPVFFFAGIRTSRWDYDIFIEKISGDSFFESPTTIKRDHHINQLISNYVRTLEKFCFRFPLNWFNFYDFWRVEI